MFQLQTTNALKFQVWNLHPILGLFAQLQNEGVGSSDFLKPFLDSLGLQRFVHLSKAPLLVPVTVVVGTQRSSPPG